MVESSRNLNNDSILGICCIEPDRAGAKQPVHWFLGGKIAIIQQGTNVWVDSPLEESLSITTGHCDLTIVTHARKMHKKILM